MLNYNKTIYFMLFLLIALCTVPFVLVLFLTVIGINLTNSTGIVVSMLLTPLVFSFAPLVIYFVATKENISTTLRIKKISLKNIILIVLMAIFIQPASNLIALIVSYIAPNNVASVMESIIDIPAWLLFLIIAVLPAILEELVFRGLIFSGVRSTGIFKAAFISGLFFAIMHLDLNQFFYALPLGIFFAYLVEYTGSIFSSIIAHFTINASQTLLMLFENSMVENNMVSEELTKTEVTTMPFEAVLVMIVITAIFSLIFAIIFKYFIEKNKPNLETIEEAPPKKIITIPFVAIIIIYIGYISFLTLAELLTH